MSLSLFIAASLTCASLFSAYSASRAQPFEQIPSPHQRATRLQSVCPWTWKCSPGSAGRIPECSCARIAGRDAGRVCCCGWRGGRKPRLLSSWAEWRAPEFVVAGFPHTTLNARAGFAHSFPGRIGIGAVAQPASDPFRHRRQDLLKRVLLWRFVRELRGLWLLRNSLRSLQFSNSVQDCSPPSLFDRR